MENIKAKVTQDIVDSIIDDVQKETVEINTRFDERLQDEIDAYRLKKEEGVRVKLQSLESQLDKKKFKIESELRFENAKKLRAKRGELLDALHGRFEKDIIAFLQTDAYAQYLNDVLAFLGSQFNLDEARIRVRKEDIALLNSKVPYEIDRLNYGGLICEVKNHIYDYSLETRFNEAMQRFINESNVSI